MGGLRKSAEHYSAGGLTAGWHISVISLGDIKVHFHRPIDISSNPTASKGPGVCTHNYCHLPSSGYVTGTGPGTHNLVLTITIT